MRLVLEKSNDKVRSRSDRSTVLDIVPDLVHASVSAAISARKRTSDPTNHDRKKLLDDRCRFLKCLQLCQVALGMDRRLYQVQGCCGLKQRHRATEIGQVEKSQKYHTFGEFQALTAASEAMIPFEKLVVAEATNEVTE